jgi:hypothetical protein
MLDTSESELVDGWCHLWLDIIRWRFQRPEFDTRPVLGSEGNRFLTYVTSRELAGPTLVVKLVVGSHGIYRRGDWGAPVYQLETELQEIASLNQGSQTPLYGMVAIGKFFRFFVFDHNIKEIRSWRPMESTRYSLNDGYLQIKMLLDSIRESGQTQRQELVRV